MRHDFASFLNEKYMNDACAYARCRKSELRIEGVRRSFLLSRDISDRAVKRGRVRFARSSPPRWPGCFTIQLIHRCSGMKRLQRNGADEFLRVRFPWLHLWRTGVYLPRRAEPRCFQNCEAPSDCGIRDIDSAGVDSRWAKPAREGDAPTAVISVPWRASLPC